MSSAETNKSVTIRDYNQSIRNPGVQVSYLGEHHIWGIGSCVPRQRAISVEFGIPYEAPIEKSEYKRQRTALSVFMGGHILACAGAESK